MQIKQLNNIRRKSFVTIYASLKSKKTLISRYGREYNIFHFINNSGNVKVLFYPSNTTYTISKCILNRKVVRLKLRVKPVKYTQPSKHIRSLNIQEFRSSLKVNSNVYSLVGVQ